jgi:CubicO group peptidase (beta-lactamase class C family)
MRAALVMLLAGPVVTSVATVDFARVREAARAEIAAGAMPGMAVAIVHGGRVVFAEGFGVANVETGALVTPATVFQVGSVGKMMTAAAVLETDTAGKIALADPVGRSATGLDPAIAALTLHQLLTHTSGLRDMPGEHGERGDEAHGRFVRSLTSSDRILAPGQTFSYSNIGYSLAGFAAAEAWRLPFAELVQARVFRPLGMTRSTLRPDQAMTWPLAPGHRRTSTGTFSVVQPMAHDTRLWPAGYVFTTAEDLARFALALLHEGRVEGRGTLAPGTPRRMLAPHTALPNLYDGGHYGYATFQFVMRGQHVAEHAGTMVGSSAVLRTVPERHFAVIVLSNSETPAVKTAEAAMEALLPLSAPAPFTSDGPPMSMDAAEMSSYVGRYENRGRFVLGVENGLLVARQNDGPPLAVTKVGARRFVATGPGNKPRLRFLLAPEEAARPAYLHFSLWGFRRTS